MSVYLDDGDVRLYHGDVCSVLATLPAGSVQTCVTSPPYWGLRDYGTGEWTGGDSNCDHAKKNPAVDQRTSTLGPQRAGLGIDNAAYTQGKAFGAECGRCGARRVDAQIGLEPTPDLYVERLVAVFRMVRRVLRDDGTLWLNLGDSYTGSAASGGTNGDRADGSGNYSAGAAVRVTGVPTKAGDGLKPKDLVGIPWRVAFALQADGWYLRSDIIWAKPNPMPESVTDRPTKAHEYVFLLSKRPKYYWDADAIREANASPEQAEHNAKYARVYEAHTERVANGQGIQPGNTNNLGIHARGGNTVGRNARSVWDIPTQPFPEAHFATFPEELARRCILAGTSERGECSACGTPWQRQVDRTAGSAKECPKTDSAFRARGRTTPLPASSTVGRAGSSRIDPVYVTTGWAASCACGAPARPQLVLDPFAGSGTVMLVARKHGRRSVGIDLSAEYLQIAAQRLSQLSLFAEG